MHYEYITYGHDGELQKLYRASVLSCTLLFAKLLITHTNEMMVGGVPNIIKKEFS